MKIILPVFRIVPALPLPAIPMFWIFRKPSLLDPFALFEELFDAPEGGEGKNTDDGRPYRIIYVKRSPDAGDARSQKDPPAFGSPMVFRLDDYGME